MIAADIKSKLVSASDIFNAPLNEQSEKYLIILDGNEQYMVRHYKRFPLGSQQDIILYKSSIESEVLKVAESLTNIQTSFVASVSILKSFMFFIDADKQDNNKYLIKHRWIEVLNDCIVGDIDIVASFARTF